jgi:hypothetical protein
MSDAAQPIAEARAASMHRSHGRTGTPANRRRLSRRGRVLAAGCAALVVVSLVIGIRAILAPSSPAFTSIVRAPMGQAWLGFGTNEYPQDRNRSGIDMPWTRSAWTLTTSRLAFMAPGLTRINVYLGWFNPSGNLTSFDWNTWQMRSLDQVLSWYNARRLAVQIGIWHDVINGPPDNPRVFTSPAWAKAQAALMDQLVKVNGYTNIYGYAGLNEWDCSYMHPPAGFALSQWQTATGELRSAFAAVGLPTALIGPDTGCTGVSPVISSAQDESGLLGAYDDHYYATERQIISGHVESTYAAAVSSVDSAAGGRQPLYIGEMGVGSPDHATDPAITSFAYGLDMFDYGVQVLRSGASGALAWCLDGFDLGKNCGMWDATGSHGGTALRPWFYSWSLLSRFFPRGASIRSIPEPSDARIAAARIATGTASAGWTFALVNRSATSPEVITLAVPGWGGGTFDEYLYSSSNRTVNGDGFPTPYEQIVTSRSGGPWPMLTVTVAPGSAVLLTTLR